MENLNIKGKSCFCENYFTKSKYIYIYHCTTFCSVKLQKLSRRFDLRFVIMLISMKSHFPCHTQA